MVTEKRQRNRVQYDVNIPIGIKMRFRAKVQHDQECIGMGLEFIDLDYQCFSREFLAAGPLRRGPLLRPEASEQAGLDLDFAVL